MKRILYIEANEDGTVGGSHKILFDLVTRLPEEYEPWILFYEDNIWADRLRDRGLRVFAWDEERERELGAYHRGGRLSTLRALVGAVGRRRGFLKEHGIDLVHLGNSPYVGHDDWVPAAMLAGVPVVAYCMGYIPPGPNAVRRALMGRCETVFSLSETVTRRIREDGIDPERIVLTYPGVDLEEFDGRDYRAPESVRQEFGLDEDQLLVAMVGNIREWKGQHVVLEALAGLDPGERARIQVLFIGQGSEEHRDYRERVEGIIERHDLQDMICFTGRREDVPDLLEAADISIHASTRAEPFGLVVQEAMLHGCAAIAANAGGPTEMMTPESGLMFDTDRPRELTAHLRALIGDPSLRRRLSEAGRRQARTFDIRGHVERITDEYRRVLD